MLYRILPIPGLPGRTGVDRATVTARCCFRWEAAHRAVPCSPQLPVRPWHGRIRGAVPAVGVLLGWIFLFGAEFTEVYAVSRKAAYRSGPLMRLRMIYRLHTFAKVSVRPSGRFGGALSASRDWTTWLHITATLKRRRTRLESIDGSLRMRHGPGEDNRNAPYGAAIAGSSRPAGRDASEPASTRLRNGSRGRSGARHRRRRDVAGYREAGGKHDRSRRGSPNHRGIQRDPQIFEPHWAGVS